MKWVNIYFLGYVIFVAGVIAGDAGTDVPAGDPGQCGLAEGGCHPAVKGLSGVAPRAWIGNYRVFNTPLPFGGCCVANSPEIVAAFEAAVKDGMDIINFSGGGPQIDPRRAIRRKKLSRSGSPCGWMTRTSQPSSSSIRRKPATR